jgi:acetyl-CoA C-acetyltransferase
LGKDYKAAMESASIEASEVDDVVSGCITQVGEQAINIARSTWLEASLLYRR